MKNKKKSGKTLRKSGKSQGKIREFDGIKKVGTLRWEFYITAVEITTGDKVVYFTADVNGGFDGRSDVIQMQVLSVHESSTRGHQ